jgi:hypothetical protein
MSGVELPVEQWRELLEDVEPPTYHATAEAIGERLDVSETTAYNAIGAALESGTLVERDGPGAFPYLHVERAYVPDGDRGVPREPTTHHYRGLEYGETEAGSFGEATEWNSWIPTSPGKSGKLPFAKYHDHPALEYYRNDEYELPASDPRRSWSDPSNWATFDDADRQVRLDPELIDRAFILQHEDEPYTWSNDPPVDPFFFADGDNVIDQETGEPIPEYVASIELLAGGTPTFQEISGSETGGHAILRGRFPPGTRTQFVQLRDEPLDGYDEPPMLELYQGPKVAVLTGERIADAPERYADVDPDGLERLMAVATAAHPNVLAAAGAGSSGGSGSADGDGSGQIDPDDFVPGLSIDPNAGPEDAPDDLPKCYRRALTARHTDERLPGLGEHGANLYTAQLSVAAGYDPDEGTEHFTLFAPNGDPSEAKPGLTKRELIRTQRKYEKGLRAPGVDTLRRVGLFDKDEECEDDCPIHGEGTDGEYVAVLPDLGEDPLPRRTFGPIKAQQIEVVPDDYDEDDGPMLVDTIQARALSTITDVMHHRRQAVVDAVMGAGKTYGAFKAAHARDEAVFYASGRKDLYEQGEAYALNVGFSEDDVYVLPSPDDCPTWRGDHGKAAKNRVRALYGRGVRVSTMHRQLDPPLPCCSGDTGGEGEDLCPYQARNQFDPDDYAVLMGHYKHAHIPRVTAGRHVVVDENPTSAFLTRIESDELLRGINAFLRLEDSPDVESFDDLLTTRHDPERRETALRWFDTAEGGQGFDFEDADE